MIHKLEYTKAVILFKQNLANRKIKMPENFMKVAFSKKFLFRCLWISIR